MVEGALHALRRNAEAGAYKNRLVRHQFFYVSLNLTKSVYSNAYATLFWAVAAMITVDSLNSIVARAERGEARLPGMPCVEKVWHWSKIP